MRLARVINISRVITSSILLLLGTLIKVTSGWPGTPYYILLIVLAAALFVTGVTNLRRLKGNA